MSIRRRPIAVLGALAVAAAFALLLGAFQHAARADTPGTPVYVSPYGCIVIGGGNTTRPAGSTIFIRGGFASQTLGNLKNVLSAQTTVVGINDGPMSDESNAYAAPFGNSADGWGTFLGPIDTGVTLANPGDQMHFTYALVLSTRVPNIFNPAGGGEAGKPVPQGPGLSFGGTCTVTATS